MTVVPATCRAQIGADLRPAGSSFSRCSSTPRQLRDWSDPRHRDRHTRTGWLRCPEVVHLLVREALLVDRYSAAASPPVAVCRTDPPRQSRGCRYRPLVGPKPCRVASYRDSSHHGIARRVASSVTQFTLLFVPRATVITAALLRTAFVSRDRHRNPACQFRVCERIQRAVLARGTIRCGMTMRRGDAS